MPVPAFPPSIGSAHSDYALLAQLRDAIFRLTGGQERFLQALPALLQNAIDFVIDPVFTARTKISELDNVEKTFIGLKIEHQMRDFLDVPKGIRDLRIDGLDVDVKNTVGITWMIPPETFRNQEPCMLIAIADERKQCWIGLFVARGEYLGAEAGNRDAKRQITASGRRNILWLADGLALPVSRWHGIDMARFRELRKLRGGTSRAAQFFRENLSRVVHRSIIQALLYDQLDYMKRLRGNQGARDILARESILLLSGAYDREKAHQRGVLSLGRDEFVALKVRP